MNRRNFLKLSACGMAGFGLYKTGFAQAKKPRNIIFILSDDHRFDAFSALNHPIAETPALDRLLQEGVHFKNAFVTHSLCSPSRASILTGLNSWNHGVLDNKTRLNPDIPTFPKLLQQAGYTTGFVGKWHMGSGSDDPRPGFDHWVSFRGQGDWFDNELNINGKRVQSEGYVSDVVTDYSLQFLDKNKNKPFCLFMSHKAVHENFTPAPRHDGKFKEKKMDRPPSFPDTDNNYWDKPDWVRRQRYSAHGVDGLQYVHGVTLDEFNSRYAECLLGLDDSIGNLTDYLERERLLNDTLIIYMGDNGFQFGEHGLIDKRVMYEASMRVPMLAHCPALQKKKGVVVEDMVLNTDIAPTLLDAAGLDAPESMHGASFFGAIKGEKLKQWREDFLYRYFYEDTYPMTPTVYGLRTDKYSYIKTEGVWDKNELYDIENDPHQLNNLLSSVPLNRLGGPPSRHLDRHLDNSQIAELVEQFEKRITELMEETNGYQKPVWGEYLSH